MILKTALIEDRFEQLLIDNTDAGANVFFNSLDPFNGDETESKYILGALIEEDPEEHDQHSPNYQLTVQYVFECLVASKDMATSLDQARLMADQAQNILIDNAAAPEYFDLVYKGAKRIIEDKRIIPLVGFQLRFQLNYLGTTTL